MQKFHFWMAAAELVFHTEIEGNAVQGSTTLNQVVKTEAKGVTVRHLSNTQIALQEQLHTKMAEQKYEVHGITFISMNYLGEMTDTEFFGPQAMAEATGQDTTDTDQTPAQSDDDGKVVQFGKSKGDGMFDADTQNI